MDLEIPVLSKASQQRKTPQAITSTWGVMPQTSTFTKCAQTQTQRTGCGCQAEGRGGARRTGSLGAGKENYYRKCGNNKALL